MKCFLSAGVRVVFLTSLLLGSAALARAQTRKPFGPRDRAGFEIRTYRVCRRALMFHQFAQIPQLARSTSFDYASSPVLEPAVGSPLFEG